MERETGLIIGMIVTVMSLLAATICAVIDKGFHETEHQLNIITNAEDCIEIEDLSMIVCKKVKGTENGKENR